MTGELELIAAAVTGALTGGVVKPFTAPFEAVGEHWKAKVAARLARADERARVKASGRSLVVNERVAFKVLTEAAFTDDTVVVEYLAGVLAGTEDPGDDAAASVLALIGRLSGLQLRLHFVCYRSLWQLERDGSWYGSPVDFRDQIVLGRLPLFIGARDLVLALGGGWVTPAAGSMVWSACRVLAREDLFGDFQSGSGVIRRHGGPSPPWCYDDAATLEMFYDHRFDDDGLVFQPSPAGIELFLWGCGANSHDPAAFPSLRAEQVEQFPIQSSAAVRVERLPPR